MPNFQSLRSFIFENGVLLFCFFLPVWPRLAVWMAALVFLSWLFRGSWSLLTRPLALLLPCLFFCYLAGMAWSENSQAGWPVLESKLSLLVFPMVLLGTPPEQLRPELWFRAFVAGCLAAVLGSLGAAVWTYFSTGESNFFYSKLGHFLGFHPTYFSMYLSLAIFGVALWPLPGKWIKYALIGLFLVFIFLLSARMQLLILAALSLGALWISAYRKGAFRIAGIATAGGLALFLGLLALLPTTRQRLERLYRPAPGELPNVRLQIWDASITVIKRYPLAGAGTGDFKGELNDAYLAKGYLAPLKDKLNAHNQFLQTAGTLGIPAALLWIGCLGWPLVLAWKYRSPLFLWFLLLFLLSNLTESMLQTQRGAMFYGFFNSLFLAGLLHRRTLQNFVSRD